MKYDIFISYRRKGGYETAKHLYDLLTMDGYTVSFDIDTLRNGDFDTALLQRIDECTDFILILNKGAFDRTLDPGFNPKNDWLRNELAYALKRNKNVIPVMLEGFDGFPEDLPDDICKVVRKNGPKYDSYYFDDFYRKMKKSFFETPEPNPEVKQSALAKSTVKFKSNLCCDYFIDGEYQDRIDEDTLQQISLPQGEYFFEFVSAYNAGIDMDSRKLKLTGEDIAFEVDLNSIVEKRESKEILALISLNSMYEGHRDFNCGLCCVWRNGLFGFVDSYLKEAVPLVYEDADDFQSYCGTVLVKRYGKCGTIDLKGKVRVPFEYDDLTGESSFTSATAGDYIRCLKDGKCGVIDQWGEVLLPLEYDALGDIVSDHVVTVSGKKAGLYDLKNRKQVLPVQYKRLYLNDCYAIFYQDGHCGLYYLDGTLTTKARYDEILPFKEDLAPVRIGSLWGFIDKADKLVISPRFDECKQFSCSLAPVRKGDKWAYIDHSGKEAIAYKYKNADLMVAGTAIVTVGDSVGLINRWAKQIYPMTEGLELRHSYIAYMHPDKAYPVLALLPSGSMELITPQGEVQKLSEEDVHEYDGFNTIILNYNNEEHVFLKGYEETAGSSGFEYDPEGLIGDILLFKADSDYAQTEESGMELNETIRKVIAEYFGKDVPQVGPDTLLRGNLGADEDDITDIMMRIEQALGVSVDSENYFRSLDSVQEIASYMEGLVSVNASAEPSPAPQQKASQEKQSEAGAQAAPAKPVPAPEPQAETAPVQSPAKQTAAPAPQPRLKRGDLYVADGVEGIVLSFDDKTGEGKLVSKKRIVNVWEDPSFGGFFKKFQAKTRPIPADDAHKDGRVNCGIIMQTKDWDFKYPCVWWCKQLDGQVGRWYLPALAEFGEDFASPEVQRHYSPLKGEDGHSIEPLYWTSNTHPDNKEEAYVAFPDGGGLAADRHHRYFLVAMRYFKL